MNHLLLSSFERLLFSFTAWFTAPSADTFLMVAAGWILCLGRHTMTGLLRTLSLRGRKSHDAYHYFFRKAAWEVGFLFQDLFYRIVDRFIPEPQTILLAGDDTLEKHTGLKIHGAGIFRDTVRSTRKFTAYAWGLNWAVLAVILPLPFLKDHYIALPILARLCPKKRKPKTPKSHNRRKKRSKRSLRRRSRRAAQKATTVQTMLEMLREVVQWLPHRQFRFLGDGAYAPLAGQLPQNVEMISRIRRDAALYKLPPKRRRKSQRGRPRQKGERLPSPEATARAPRTTWERTRLTLYGEHVDMELHSYVCLWWEVAKSKPIRVVCVRDPEGKRETEFFFSTNTQLTGKQIAEGASHRWPIEVAFREAKQDFGMGDSQARTKKAVERITPFCLWLLSLVKFWYLTEGHRVVARNTPQYEWYCHKSTISFSDVLAALRRATWKERISAMSGLKTDVRKMLQALVNVASGA